MTEEYPYLDFYDIWLTVREYDIILLPAAVLVVVVCLFKLCLKNEISNYKQENIIGDGRKRSASINKGGKEKDTSIRGSPIAHPTTSDIGSPTLVSDGSYRDFSSEEPVNHRNNTVTAKGIRKRTLKQRNLVTQESLEPDTFCSLPCIQACLEQDCERKVYQAFQYLKLRETFRKDAEQLTRAINHLDILEERQRERNLQPDQHGFPPDYTDAELYEINGRDASPQYIESFVKLYGFPPTPYELSDYVVEFDLDKRVQRRRKRKKENLQMIEARMNREKTELQNKVSSLQQKLLQCEKQALRSKCKVCHDSEVSVVMKPCQHAFCCSSCAKVLFGKPKHSQRKKDCLICGAKVSSSQTFYLS